MFRFYSHEAHITLKNYTPFLRITTTTTTTQITKICWHTSPRIVSTFENGLFPAHHFVHLQHRKSVSNKLRILDLL